MEFQNTDYTKGIQAVRGAREAKAKGVKQSTLAICAFAAFLGSTEGTGVPDSALVTAIQKDVPGINVNTAKALARDSRGLRAAWPDLQSLDEYVARANALRAGPTGDGIKGVPNKPTSASDIREMLRDCGLSLTKDGEAHPSYTGGEKRLRTSEERKRAKAEAKEASRREGLQALAAMTPAQVLGFYAGQTEAWQAEFVAVLVNKVPGDVESALEAFYASNSAETEAETERGSE